MIPVLVFDIETIPDVNGLRALTGMSADCSDAEVATAAYAARREKTGSDFLQHHLHRIAAISCVFRTDAGFRVRSLGSLDDAEPKLVRDFFRVIDRYTPQIVSWNGGGFDLPVLHYRYHSRHLDLMDHLAMYTGRANAPLDDLAKLCGFPGKMGVDGSQVWSLYQQGRLEEIRNYCETDVVNTYLVYCRYQLMRGNLTQDAYNAELNLVRTSLAELTAPHWQEYLLAWPISSKQ